MIDFTGKTALVTGGSRGIGAASAVALARHGADVAVNYRKGADGAAETARAVTALGRRAIAVQADVSQDADVTAMVARVAAELGPVDILVNNAGWARRQEIDDITEADWDAVMAVNLKSVFLMTRAVLPHMRAQRWGRIVNVSSGAARSGGSVGIHYSASKGGMDALTRAYAKRLASEGITVNAVAPSVIDTRMMADIAERGKRIPIGRAGTAEECADAVTLCAGTEYMTGQVVYLNGGTYFA